MKVLRGKDFCHDSPANDFVSGQTSFHKRCESRHRLHGWLLSRKNCHNGRFLWSLPPKKKYQHIFYNWFWHRTSLRSRKHRRFVLGRAGRHKSLFFLQRILLKYLLKIILFLFFYKRTNYCGNKTFTATAKTESQRLFEIKLLNHVTTRFNKRHLTSFVSCRIKTSVLLYNCQTSYVYLIQRSILFQYV
jgi:hypothetical protein